MPGLIKNLQIRVSAEELAELQDMAAIHQAPVGSVVRAMIRHFLIRRTRGDEVVAELGMIVWPRREPR